MGFDTDSNQNEATRPLLLLMKGRVYDVAQFAAKHPGGQKVWCTSGFSIIILFTLCIRFRTMKFGFFNKKKTFKEAYFQAIFLRIG